MNYAEKVEGHTVRVYYYDRATGEPMPAAYAQLICIPMMPEHLLGDWPAADIAFNWEGVFVSAVVAVVFFSVKRKKKGGREDKGGTVWD
jgi:hypothetical protein